MGDTKLYFELIIEMLFVEEVAYFDLPVYDRLLLIEKHITHRPGSHRQRGLHLAHCSSWLCC